jgi:hypothetical protein
VPNAVSTRKDCAVSKVLICCLPKSYRHVYASSNIADDNSVSPREGISGIGVFAQAEVIAARYR